MGKYCKSPGLTGVNLNRMQQQERTGPDLKMKVRVTLEQIYSGADFDLTYNRKIICPHCRGSGADDPDHVKTCNKCGGTGQII